MRRYSFRLFLRDLIQFPEGTGLEALTRYCSMRTVRSYLLNSPNWIVALGSDRSYRLISKQISVLARPWNGTSAKSCSVSSWRLPSSMCVSKTPAMAGIDVIALVSGHLVYVEVKSSPPRGVELPAVSGFLNRLRDLQPQVAVFLVDTELRMKDKIVELFAEALAVDPEPAESYEVERLVDEIFHIRHAVYLVNSRKGIYSNLRVLFRDFLRAGKNAGNFMFPWHPAGKPP